MQQTNLQLEGDIAFMKRILPGHYKVEESGKVGSIHCVSSLGIKKANTVDTEDEEHWDLIFKAIKQYFGLKFQEVDHNTCFLHKDFTVYLNDKLIIHEDNICPKTKEPCDDECCPPGAECNFSDEVTEVQRPENRNICKEYGSLEGAGHKPDFNDKHHSAEENKAYEIALTSSALKFQSTDSKHPYPSRYNGKVPLKVKMNKTVLPDSFPFIRQEHLRAEINKEYYVYVNSFGAVSAIMKDGKQLGLKQWEFEITQWHK